MIPFQWGVRFPHIPRLHLPVVVWLTIARAKGKSSVIENGKYQVLPGTSTRKYIGCALDGDFAPEPPPPE